MLRKLAVRVLVFLAVLYVGWCVTVYFVQDSMLFPRSAAPTPRVLTPPEGAEVWSIAAADGLSIPAWFWPGEGRTPANPGPALVYAHGNAERMEHCVGRARVYQSRGVSVLIVEYRGYGTAPGLPSQDAIVGDFARAYDELVKRSEVDASRVLGHGRSLGGGVIAQLAARRPMAGLVLESTFTSVASFSWSLGVPGFLARHPFRTDEVLAGLNAPVLLLHGEDDDIVPLDHARRLAALAPRATLSVQPGRHNDFPADANAYRSAIGEWLVRWGFASPPGTGGAPGVPAVEDGDA